MGSPASFGWSAATGMGDGTLGCRAAGLPPPEPHPAIAPAATARRVPISIVVFNAAPFFRPTLYTGKAIGVPARSLKALPAHTLPSTAVGDRKGCLYH